MHYSTLFLTSLLLSSLEPASARLITRRIPSTHRRMRRQGSLVQSTEIDFGKCSVPQITGGVGIEGRKEFSFIPTDLTSYPHGSAQNIGIITQFICDTLVNTCGATTAAHDLCTATEASIGTGKDNGALADTFNAAFGVTTKFVDATGSSGAAAGAGTGDSAVVTSPATGSLVASNEIDFGKCSTPQITGGLGIEGRKEFSFIPTDLTSYPHGSAQNIGIITQFICDTLVNTCGATTAAHDLCTATEAAIGAGKDNGAFADIFNAAFGITTNFVNAAGSSGATGSGTVTTSSAAAGVTAAPTTTSAAADGTTTTVVTVTVTVPCDTPTSTASAPAATASQVLIDTGSVDLGSCSDPTILFKNGLDGRNTPAFIAQNQKDFKHGSVQGIKIITDFITQRLSSPCNAGADAIAAAAAGAAAAQAAGGTSGAAADAWNVAFGITTTFVNGATR